MGDFTPTGLAALLQIGHGLAMDAAMDKQLQRFGIASHWNDANISEELALADTGLLDFLGNQLALAIYNHA